MKKWTVFIFLLSAITACHDAPPEVDYSSLDRKENAILLERARRYFQALPIETFPTQRTTVAHKVNLGKMLYYDTRLSKYGTYSCNSCHNLSSAGVDNKQISTVRKDKSIQRNVPTVLNAAFQVMSAWDGRGLKNKSDDQPGLAIPHTDILSRKLKELKEYEPLFAQSFPEEKEPVNLLNLQEAIVAFERTLVTPTNFDKYLLGNVYALSFEEREGLKLFMNVGCTDCHSGTTLGGTMIRKFGEANDYHPLTGSSNKDQGLKNITHQEQDKDKFKVAGLRNIGRTYPYFHDGSVEYLSNAVRIMAKTQLNKELDDDEVRLIVIFLNALSGEVPADAQKPPIGMLSN